MPSSPSLPASLPSLLPRRSPAPLVVSSPTTTSTSLTLIPEDAEVPLIPGALAISADPSPFFSSIAPPAPSPFFLAMTDGSQLPQVNDVVEGSSHKYNLLVKLGDGGYGVVFSCMDKNDKRVAIKVEKLAKSMLAMELEVMRAARAKECKHFCEAIDYGTHKPHYAWIVLTLLNKDLHKLRNEMPNRKFTRNTALRIGVQTLEAIRELHSLGYISRDVKPGNFGPGTRENRQHKTIFMFDFGLARKHSDKNGNIVPQRKDAGWRGTSRYGSLEAHQRRDLGRRDDVESWFYMLVEVTKGTLPWRLVPERENVHKAKKTARESGGRKMFLYDTPKVYDEFLTKIDSMSYESEPDYGYFIKELKEIAKDAHLKDSEQFDWDDDNSTRSTNEVKSTASYSEEDKNKEGSDNKHLHA